MVEQRWGWLVSSDLWDKGPASGTEEGIKLTPIKALNPSLVTGVSAPREIKIPFSDALNHQFICQRKGYLC